MKVEAFLCFLLKLRMIGAQFIEQPDPGTVLSFDQDKVILTCSLEEGYIVDWRVAFSIGEDAAFASSRISHMLLIQQGFTLEGIGTRRSILSLRETDTQNNSGVNITCAAQEKGVISSTTFGNTVQVIFYGAPPPPASLRVIKDEMCILNISWSLNILVDGVPVNFTLTALNLNTTKAEPIIITGLIDQHYVLELSRPCDMYRFTVTAAGKSTPSQEFIINGNITCCSGSDHNGLYIGATIAAALTIVVLFTTAVLMLYYFCRRIKGNRKRSSVKIQDYQHSVHGSDTAGDQPHANLRTHSNAAVEAVQRTMYTNIDKKTVKQVDELSKEEKSATLYASLDSIKSTKAKMMIVDDQEASKNQLYAQVADHSKKKARKNPTDVIVDSEVLSNADNSQAADQALYAEVNKSDVVEAAAFDSEVTVGQVHALYAQVDKSKKVKRKKLKSKSLMTNSEGDEEFGLNQNCVLR